MGWLSNDWSGAHFSSRASRLRQARAAVDLLTRGAEDPRLGVTQRRTVYNAALAVNDALDGYGFHYAKGRNVVEHLQARATAVTAAGASRADDLERIGRKLDEVEKIRSQLEAAAAAGAEQARAAARESLGLPA